MDLSFSPTERDLAEQFRTWLRTNLQTPGRFGSADEELEWGRRWQALLAKDRWIAIDWPAEYGGRGASPIDVALVNLEYGRSGAPQLVNRVGLNLAGPTILAWGTPRQRSKWLPGIVDATEIWCQLFSEPSAGSDLAALRTRATRVDGGYLLSGQKVWNSYAQYSRWGLCLARTSDTARPQAGITYLAVDMHSPGVDVRPLRQITGESEFNEVFLDDVFIEESCRIGPENQGWRVAGTTLAHERGTNFPIKEQTLHERYMDQLLRHPALAADSAARSEFARCYIGLRLLTLSNLKTLSRLAAGIEPGPESSVTKLQWMELTQRFSRLWLDIAPDDPDAQRQFLWSFVAGIAGGTNEIQRTIIGERILRLPRE